MWNITTYLSLLEQGISEDEEKLSPLLSKKAAVLTIFRMDLFKDAHRWEGGGRPLCLKFVRHILQ